VTAGLSSIRSPRFVSRKRPVQRASTRFRPFGATLFCSQDRWLSWPSIDIQPPTFGICLPTDLTLAPLWGSHAFRKYDSTCVAVVSARLWKLANPANSSGKAQPQHADFSTESPDVQKSTQIRSRGDEARRITANIAKLAELALIITPLATATLRELMF
jgi:hypothetical protein